MSYKMMSEILLDLEALQRTELSQLADVVEVKALYRTRMAKRQLFTVAQFFIERSWEMIAADIGGFTLEAHTGWPEAKVQEQLEKLRLHGPAYAWAWIRARMNERLFHLLEPCVAALMEVHPEEAELYRKRLRHVGHYWFRESPMRHLKAGYHTALGVTCKWYGSAIEMQQDLSICGSPATGAFRSDLRKFASFSMTMLARTDAYLWDSANSKPLSAVLEEGKLVIMERDVAELDLSRATDYGVRLGCPALRARHGYCPPAFEGMIDWVEAVFFRYLNSDRS